MAGDNKSKKSKKNTEHNTRAAAASSASKPDKSDVNNSDSSDDEDTSNLNLKELLAEHSEEISRRILAEIDERIAAAVVKATADLGNIVTEQRDNIIKLEENVTIQSDKLKEL